MVGRPNYTQLYTTIHNHTHTATLECQLPDYLLHSLRQMFFAKPLKVFTNPVIVFTICA